MTPEDGSADTPAEPVGEVRRGRVRNGIVRVHDVEPMLLGDPDDGVREGEQVLRLPKQRIPRYVDALEGEARDAGPPPERLVAADQVNLMFAQRERVRELGRHHTAAAEGRIADDTYLHGRCLNNVGRTTGSLTTTPSAKLTPASAPNWASRLSISWRKVGAVSRVGTMSSSSSAF